MPYSIILGLDHGSHVDPSLITQIIPIIGTRKT